MRTLNTVLVLLFGSLTTVQATHLRAGEIEVKRADCNTLTFQITLVIYVNTNSNVLVGGENTFLSFGDGSAPLQIPETPITEIINASLPTGKTIITLEHTYAAPGRYVIRFIEGNRNEGIVNMSQSASTMFQIETMIFVEEGQCNTYPVLLSEPIDRACQKTAFSHTPAAYDADNDSLSYEIALPKKNADNTVDNYRFPNDRNFYSGDYSKANESDTGEPIFIIDPVTGILTWDAPGAVGEYATSIKIIEWKKDASGEWYEASYIVRDMQILVNSCDNTRPALSLTEEVCIVAGDTLDLTLIATDPDGDSVMLDFYSEIFIDPAFDPSFSPPINAGKSLASPAEVTLTLPTSCDMVRAAPYLVNVKISDKAPGDVSLSKYYTIKIWIIAPAPEIEALNVNPVSREVSLQWKISSCDNVESFQIWRRTSSIEYAEPQCARGMPDYLRYDLLAVVPSSQLNYTDTNLEIGSQYCYRIVALVNGNNPGKVSLDTCLIPKPAEAPVITNVSVEATHPTAGKIFVAWTSPFDIDATQYPPPYEYKVFRMNETLGSGFEPVSQLISDTIFTDDQINTEQYAFRYFVELYVSALTSSPVDSSSKASSIVATSQPKISEINLQWSANTPWSNYSEKDPYHLIFRSASSDGPFQLIDSTNVINNGFMYTDRGEYDGAGLSNDPYFYIIKTRGTYGNPNVKDPLENLSPGIQGELLDTIPPCPPVAKVESVSCNQYSCDGQSYYTLLTWETPDQACSHDVVFYEVLVKIYESDHYVSLGTTAETSYHHNDLTNLDYCYRVVAIDKAGNRSDSSSVVCNTSCINFKLPNVITPGNDGNNDFLTTYDGENATADDCARSVLRVKLLVYNRWGNQIFVRDVDHANNNIFWPGTNKRGTEVSAGTYFYRAQVQFQTSDPSKREKEFKGWVHVVR